MSRLLHVLGSAVAAWGFMGPGPALADVLQIDSQTSHWVAGPGATSAPTGSAQDILSDNPAYTQAVAVAGPGQWQAIVAALAAKYDISPALLEAVVWQESRWRPAATSAAGAHGLAQLMPGTARQLGVDIRDPAANLEGGTRYLRMQLDTFGGDVEKALAAYNAGPGRVDRAGGVPNIPETQAYVAAIMARLSASVRR